MHTTRTDSEIKLEAIEKAREVLRDDKLLSSHELLDLSKELIGKDQFAYAAEILLKKIKQDQALQNEPSVEDHENLAKYIYKDHSLPSSVKFDRALVELERHCNLMYTERCEPLGLAGAIYKYKWQYDHRFSNLTLSLYYYRNGYLSWQKYLGLPLADKEKNKHCNDNGYTAINYAYVSELMAIDKLEEIGDKVNDFSDIERLLEEAKAVRTFILRQFGLEPFKPVSHKPDYDYWKLVTIAEAFFGLSDYTNANEFIGFSILRMINDKKLKDDERTLAWQLRSFNQQMNWIAYFQFFQKDWARKSTANSGKSPDYLIARAEMIDIDKIKNCVAILADPMSTFSSRSSHGEIGESRKLGLALSGGGFRAAIFHIGVLAALAERDVLKNVEVISCVSGGSIIGAYYYLKLRKALETCPDGQVNYIKLVEEIEKEFLPAVQRNIRMRVFSNLFCNFKMILFKNYSRTHRLGELYEEHLYRPLVERDDELLMRNLIIKPYNDNDFSIATDNWKRQNKVPQIILNATTVNTGHNWQFAGSWMGEPPGTILRDIDMKPRLRRMYYTEAPGNFKNFRLGHAVGASSCVPVLFEPLPMFGLYENEEKEPINLQLIDGGLHDNQGIASLIEQECQNMVISDASGQMSVSSDGASGELSVFYRADTILQERLRELQFQDIKERNNTAQINDLTSLHLKSDLIEKPIAWINCKDAPRKLFDVENDVNRLYTKYGVLRTIQKLLSGIRTDLDSFHEIESSALIYSAYNQTLHKLKNATAPNDEVQKGNWQFTKIKPYLTDQTKSEQIEGTLRTSSKVALKPFHLSKVLLGNVVAVGITCLYFFIRWCDAHWQESLYVLRAKEVFIFVAVFLIAMVSSFLADMINYRAFIRRKLTLFALAIVGFIASWLYLVFLNPFYNRAGKIPWRDRARNAN